MRCPDAMSDPATEGTLTPGGSGVAARLLRSSSSFARSAIAAYTAEDWDVYFLHLATAVEHLLKGAIARINPAFIADPRAKFDSLLHLTGMGDRAQSPDFLGAVRTISAADALERAARVVDGYRAPGEHVNALLETRNGIVHVGHTAGSEGEAVLGDVARFVNGLLPAVGMTEASYWGDAAGFVAQHASKRLGEIELLFERQLRRARDQYASTVAGLPDNALPAVLKALEPAGPSDDFTEFPVECPACLHQGVLTGEPEPEWEPDWDYGDGQTYIAGMYVASITLRASEFTCRICKLSLAGAGLELAHLDSMTFADPWFDGHLAYVYFRRLEAEDSRDY
jgi:hypothetical protein